MVGRRALLAGPNHDFDLLLLKRVRNVVADVDARLVAANKPLRHILVHQVGLVINDPLE
jgi:hypothetical protein